MRRDWKEFLFTNSPKESPRDIALTLMMASLGGFGLGYMYLGYMLTGLIVLAVQVSLLIISGIVGIWFINVSGLMFLVWMIILVYTTVDSYLKAKEINENYG